MKKDIITKDQFLNIVRDYEFNVHLDQGYYRHISVNHPKHPIATLYQITTCPDFMTISGGNGTYTFNRYYDLFPLFRSTEYTLKPSYWFEKLVGMPKYGCMEFSIEKCNERLYEILDDFKDYCESEHDDLREYDAAKNAVDYLIEYTNPNQHDYVEAINDFDDVGEFALSDFWDGEYVGMAFKPEYIFTLYMIMYIINRYDEYCFNKTK